MLKFLRWIITPQQDLKLNPIDGLLRVSLNAIEGPTFIGLMKDTKLVMAWNFWNFESKWNPSFEL